ncbi:hypothetical protein HPP92_027472, partial [Vanilla planifolia]
MTKRSKRGHGDQAWGDYLPMTGLYKVVRPSMELTPAQCQKFNEDGDQMIGESMSETPMNI